MSLSFYEEGISLPKRVFRPDRPDCSGMYCRGCDDCEGISTSTKPVERRSRETIRDLRIIAVLDAQARDDAQRCDRYPHTSTEAQGA